MTHLIICQTCQQKNGAVLYDLVSEGGSREGLKITGHECLWSCASACSVQIRADGKCGYHLGGFQATEDAAAALLDFAVEYNLSPTGEVDFDLWPEGIKGHFIARIPPLL
ncbi:MAG: DUF1636 family protein [Emcibacter sp.]|nr:DUF1636 family protein [Emcibacter sp.]